MDINRSRTYSPSMPIFSSKHRSVIFSIPFLVFLACSGNTERPRGLNSEYFLGLNLDGKSELRDYPLEDPDCQVSTDSADFSLGTAALSTWTAKGLSFTHHDLEALKINSNPLRGNFISQANIGATFLRSCDLNASPPPLCLGKANTLSGWLPIDQGKAIKVCTRHVSPKRYHAEHLALSALLIIEAVAPKIKERLPKDAKLDPLLIQVAPIFSSRWHSQSQNQQQSPYRHVLTDNLSYISKTESSPPFIAILPQRKVQGSSTAFNLWESPFVVVHEYAHYIEDVLGLARFNEPRGVIQIAVSEAFADTISYATLGNSDHIAAVPCTGKDRAPDSLEYANGVAKIFTKQLLLRAAAPSNLSVIEPDKIASQDPHCQGVLPHSAHGFGAIFAHWLLELASLTPNYKDDSGKHLSDMAIAWLKEFDHMMRQKTLEPNNASPDSDPQALAGQVETAAVALETVLTRQFQRQMEPIPQNVRELLRQKMSLAFGDISKHQWFQDDGQR